jgi:hypothetical protein
VRRELERPAPGGPLDAARGIALGCLIGLAVWALVAGVVLVLVFV